MLKCGGQRMKENKKYVFTIEQIQVAFEEMTIEDAFDKLLKETELSTPEQCRSCKTSPCPMKETEKDFIQAVGCAFKKDGE
jgi:hypothetical protein